MKKIAIALFLFLPLSVQAATLRPYTPGGAPCAGACTYEWAVEQFDVPEGIPGRMMIPEGSIVVKMSYAKNGVPHAMDDSAVLSEDEPGEGYSFERHGVQYLMVKIDKCQNWAVMIMQGVSLPQSPTPKVKPLMAFLSGGMDNFNDLQFHDVDRVAYTPIPVQSVIFPKPRHPPVLPPTVTPSPVPISASFFNLLAVVFGLGLFATLSIKKD